LIFIKGANCPFGDYKMTVNNHNQLFPWGLYSAGLLAFIFSGITEFFYLIGIFGIFISSGKLIREYVKEFLFISIFSVAIVFFTIPEIDALQFISYLCGTWIFFLIYYHNSNSFLTAVIAMSFIMLVSYMIYFYFHPDYYKEILSRLDMNMSENSFLTKNMNEEQILFLKDKLIPFYRRIFYFLRFMEIFIINYLLVLICLKISRRINWLCNEIPRFSESYLPGAFFWLFLISLAGQILMKNSYFDYFLNLMIGCLFLYLIYGFSLSGYWLKKIKRKGFIIMMMVIGFFIAQPFFFIAFILFGLSDYWMNWKKRFN